MTNSPKPRIDLLDVNVLVSLGWPNHVHHAAATEWFASRPATQAWATTPITESGFVRISSNRKAIPTAVSPNQAIAVLNAIRKVPGHKFLADDIEQVLGSDSANSAVKPNSLATHRHVTDAHLLALAARHGARLVTFDRGVQALTDELDLIQLIR